MSEVKAAINAHRVKLSTGKTVMLKEMKLKYQNLAIQAVGQKAKDNQVLMGALAQQELLKILIIEINDEPADKKKIENLDECFSYGEIVQLMKALEQITGGEASGEVETEFVTGSK